MEVDTDNPEDVSDLEARLYSQVHHHDAANERPTLLGPSSVVGLSAIPYDVNNPARYWSRGQQAPRSKKHINPFAGFAPSKKEEAVEDTSAPPKDTKPFCPYVPYFSNQEVTPDASGGDQVAKGSPSQILEENSEWGSVCLEKNVAKNFGNYLPHSRNISKLSNAIKYQLKKMKANQVRAKQKEQRRRVIETIVVESSDEDDDVVEIPLPKPPTVTIDSSGESEAENDDSKTFVKPQGLPKSDDKVSSRCVSPSSVMSDDFIGQTDCSRILQHRDVADDEDLVFVQETVDSCVYQNKRNDGSGCGEEGNSLVEKSDFVTPRRKSTPKSTDYNVTQSNFRALDVYESESSDMPDCDKDKDTSLKVNLRSGNEADKERSKKLRKRRKSGSAKGSEPNESSESEAEQNTGKTGLSFIKPGEAVENYKESSKKRSRNAAGEDPSDKKFISMLASISRPKKSPDQLSESDISAISTEDITARELVEEVLNKKSKSGNKAKGAEVEVVEEKSDAIPLDTTADIDRILDSIDKMQSVIESSESEGEKEEIEEYTGEEEMLSITDVLKYQKPHEIAPEENGLHSVYTHGKNIGWSEEMVRFYDWSWGQEKYNVRQVRRTMDPAAKWTIYTEDRFPKTKRFANLKCFNCCEFGHTRARCPKPKKDLICYMCGEIGHTEPRCPNTICLRCGNKTNVFTRSCHMCTHQNQLICPICKVRGHSTQLCPDKWRRYHSTTQSNEYPNKTVEYNERKFCCICAGKGHLSEHCKSGMRFSEYPATVTEIKSYAKAYDDDLIKFPLGRNVTGYSLVSRPCDGVLFNFPYDITPNKYYGRFLKAVNLDHLMTWTKKGTPSKRKTDSLPEEEPKKKTKRKNYVLNPFAKKNKDKAVGTSVNPEKTAQEEHPQDDIVLNVDSNKIQEDALETREMPSASMPVQTSENTSPKAYADILKTPKASPSLNPAPTSEISPHASSDLQSENGNETTTSYATFSKNINENQSTPNQNKSKCRKVGPLPDFIPLNNSDDDVDDDDVENMLRDIERYYQLETSGECQAKIYLSKFHSNFLLSPEGNKQLTEISKKSSVKTKIEWTSVGNVLIIDGSVENQDNFHKELMKTFVTLSDQANRKMLEKSQKLPKRREALINFLQDNILQLHKHLGHVPDLYRRLQTAQKQSTKSSWKGAEKLRKTLNTILMGQAGLRKGKENLEALMNNLKALQENNSEGIVSEEKRAEISEQWKYIFSSYQHENYEELIEQYMTLKKKNELPKPNINYHLLGIQSVTASLTDEQKRQLSYDPQKEKQKEDQQVFIKSEEKLTPAVQKPAQQEVQKADVNLNQTSPNFAKQQFRRPNAMPRRNFKPRSFGPDQTNQQEFGGWRNRPRNFPNQMDRPPKFSRNNNANNFTTPSVFWSKKCMKVIDDCLGMNPGRNLQYSLYKLQENARMGLLSQHDFRGLLSMRDVI